MSEPNIKGVIIALENVIQDKLADSQIVRLENLGTFYPNLHSSEEVTTSNIKRIGVRCRVGKRILDNMKMTV